MARTLVEQPVEGVDSSAPLHQTTREVAQRLAALTCRVLGCRRVGLLAAEPETRRWRALAVWGLTAEQERRWRNDVEQLPRSGEGANQEMLARFEAGEALVIQMTQPPYDGLTDPYGITTSLYVPMRIGTQVVGMLALDYDGEGHAFTEEERALAGAVGQLAALVIERERLFYERAQA
jgi:GAF domain-containing protein